MIQEQQQIQQQIILYNHQQMQHQIIVIVQEEIKGRAIKLEKGGKSSKGDGNESGSGDEQRSPPSFLALLRDLTFGGLNFSKLPYMMRKQQLSLKVKLVMYIS